MGIKVKKNGAWEDVQNNTFNALTELTSVEDADEMVIYDDSASVYKKVGVDTLRELTPPTMIVEHQETSGTNGGGFSSGAWRTRSLNTEVQNNISSASINTSTGVITLPAGTYEIEFWAMAFRVNRNAARLYDTTNSTELITGSSANSNVGGDDGSENSIGHKTITLSGSANIELQHRCETTNSSHGFGLAVGTAFTVAHEVFAQVVIKKVS